ncbi:hypothetical protein NMQ14_01280 [Methyloversatilis sp. XJ19-13]|uniref:hypothetical protein n=1 Tax=Methyloversatilis sp. XJ19-13 TaxID=2963430 RepID=UPI00211B7FD7|nr:hypothetical protein [Methyloversatilis sp. XJ19-13]MCQ9372876.1 hypothetical protein [Methyloversatilis sp. XJ19-13]
MARQHQLRHAAGQQLRIGQRIVGQCFDRQDQSVAAEVGQQHRDAASQVKQGSFGLAHVVFPI